jgi:hypothetical protein
MADSLVRLRIDSAEYDQKLKRAAEGLTRYADECRKVGGTLEVVEKETLDYVRAVGQMETVSRTATGKLSEMKKTFVELSVQYQQMTEAEQQSPYGKATAKSLDELKARIIESKAQLEEANRLINGDGAKGGGGGLFSSDKLSGMLQVFGGNLMTKAAGMAAGFAAELGDAVKQGVELAKQGEGIRMAFERLGRGDILQGLREATHGTMTDLELMKAAVQFNDFKLPLEELGTMLAFAQQKAKDTGQSVDYMASSIVTGLGRKSVMILDNLGLGCIVEFCFLCHLDGLVALNYVLTRFGNLFLDRLCNFFYSSLFSNFRKFNFLNYFFHYWNNYLLFLFFFSKRNQFCNRFTPTCMNYSHIRLLLPRNREQLLYDIGPGYPFP